MTSKTLHERLTQDTVSAATPPRRPPTQWKLPAMVAVTLATSVLCQFTVLDQAPIYALANAIASTALAVTGVIVCARPAQIRLGISFIICGLLWSLQWMGTWNVGPFPIIGGACNALFWVVAGWGFLQYPNEVRRTLGERIFLISLCLVIVGGQALLTLSSTAEMSGFDGSAWWWSPFADQVTRTWIINVFGSLENLAALGFLMVMAIRLKKMTKLDRVLILPLAIAVAIISLASSFTNEAELHPTTQLTPYFFWSSILLAMGVPIGLVISTVHRRLKSVSVSDTLHKQLARDVLSVEAVRQALRDVLQDPSLDVYYWSPELSTYIDASGRAVQLPHLGTHLVRQVTTRTREPLAMIVGDIALSRHPEALETAIRAGTMALENARLHANVRSQLEEVRQSRARIAEAALAERYRIERDLHDGVQQRLLAVVAHLGIARREADESGLVEIGDEVGRASHQLRSTLKELRNLARGINPPELRQFGLRAAIEVSCGHLPLDIEIDIVDQRFSPAAETVAYYVICEALANVMKHANATSVSISVDNEPDALTISIVDTGIGGADLTKGTGLTGLIDRLQTVGGSLDIDSGSQGTSLRASIPWK